MKNNYLQSTQYDTISKSFNAKNDSTSTISHIF